MQLCGSQSELAIFNKKEEQRTTLKALLDGIFFLSSPDRHQEKFKLSPDSTDGGNAVFLM